MRDWNHYRTYAFADPTLLDADGGSDDELAPTDPIETVPVDQANLVSSLLTTGDHAPVLDIDFPARLMPSSTAGHYHLYLDGITLSWDDYVRVLTVLGDVGIIGPGYLKHSLARGQTVVRRPGVRKGRSAVPPKPVFNDEEPF